MLKQPKPSGCARGARPGVPPCCRPGVASHGAEALPRQGGSRGPVVNFRLASLLLLLFSLSGGGRARLPVPRLLPSEGGCRQLAPGTGALSPGAPQNPGRFISRPVAGHPVGYAGCAGCDSGRGQAPGGREGDSGERSGRGAGGGCEKQNRASAGSGAPEGLPDPRRGWRAPRPRSQHPRPGLAAGGGVRGLRAP